MPCTLKLSVELWPSPFTDKLSIHKKRGKLVALAERRYDMA